MGSGGVSLEAEMSRFEVNDMRIYESLSYPGNDVSVRDQRKAGWRKMLVAVTLLTSATGIGLAQHHDSDDAFLPSPVRSVSTVPGNGDVNPYGVAFVEDNF